MNIVDFLNFVSVCVLNDLVKWFLLMREVLFFLSAHLVLWAFVIIWHNLPSLSFVNWQFVIKYLFFFTFHQNKCFQAIQGWVKLCGCQSEIQHDHQEQIILWFNFAWNYHKLQVKLNVSRNELLPWFIIGWVSIKVHCTICQSEITRWPLNLNIQCSLTIDLLFNTIILGELKQALVCERDGLS